MKSFKDNMIDVLIGREDQDRHTEGICVMTQGDPSASQRDRPQKEPTLLIPGSWTCSLQNYEEINFC
jgi:hypothetical protein